MYATFIAICSLVILLGFEIRYRLISEEIVRLRSRTNVIDEEIFRLKEALKMKKDAFEEYKPPK